jgi:hypothetical protein
MYMYIFILTYIYSILGCISIGNDEKNVPVIICIPRIAFDRSTVNENEIKKMFLLFILMADSIINKPFSIVYAHDGFQYWLQRQPIIFKFYKILPRKIKRNLESLYIIHPNIGIKRFFAFSRVFLSKRFFEKLVYVVTIFDFQKIISPLCLSLPYNYLLMEVQLYMFICIFDYDRIHIYMCIYMYTCIFIYVYIWIYIYICLYIDIFLDIQMFMIYLYVHVYKSCIYTYESTIFMYLYTYIHTDMYIYENIFTYTYIFMYIHMNRTKS